MTTYEKYCQLNIDGRWINLEETDNSITYFCTPIGANIIGWENGGIHYCFIKGFGEMVFAVNPDSGAESYVYPLAKNFEDFLRLILACGSTTAVEQIILWNKEQFERFLHGENNSIVTEQREILDKIQSELNLTPMENPFEYVKEVQAQFDDRKIRFTDEYYNVLGVERQSGMLFKTNNFINNKNISIMSSILLFSIAITLIDAFIHPNYFVKIPIKILFFLAFPILFFVKNKDMFEDFKKLFVFKKTGILKAILLGIGVYVVILGGYFLMRNIIDFSQVTSTLTEGMGITAKNFIYVSLYISLMNSFLEEFFFRGFGFITLKKYTTRKFAYIFSTTLFAIYHVGMLVDMFNFWTLLLLLLGVGIGGCIFNYLNELNDNIYPSWFVHMFANFAINTVGFILFGA